MILDEYVTVGISPLTLKWFEERGYEIPRKRDKKGRVNYTKGTKIKVRVIDLPPQSNTKVRCKCEKCGLVREVTYSTLISRYNSQYTKTGETLCVKCRNSTYFGENNAQYKHGCNRYCEYKNNAKRRGIIFDLTAEQFKEMIAQPCHYCGGFSSDYDKSSRGNGIDRKDSSKGYEIGNCVPCCSKCNFVKNTMPYDDFIDYIKRIYERVCKNEN